MHRLRDWLAVPYRFLVAKQVHLRDVCMREAHTNKHAKTPMTYPDRLPSSQSDFVISECSQWN